MIKPFVLIDLDQIEDNPYQVRERYGDIKALAADIKARWVELPQTLGLIHVPNARRHKGRIQIAEGHRRLRAFRLLAETDDQYSQMPLNLVELSDDAMDDLVWSENKQRHNFSPIEEAAALSRTMEERGLTQGAMAALRQMARSTLANKLRLLKLPMDIQIAIHRGDLSERTGIALVPIIGLQHPAVATLFQRLLAEGDMTSEQVRREAEWILRSKPVQMANRQLLPPSVVDYTPIQPDPNLKSRGLRCQNPKCSSPNLAIADGVIYCLDCATEQNNPMVELKICLSQDEVGYLSSLGSDLSEAVSSLIRSARDRRIIEFHGKAAE